MADREARQRAIKRAARLCAPGGSAWLQRSRKPCEYCGARKPTREYEAGPEGATPDESYKLRLCDECADAVISDPTSLIRENAT